MNDAIIWAGVLLLVTGMICVTALIAWRGWLDLKRAELGARAEPAPPELTPAVRIEVSHLKERLRKLEAIARGVDL